MFGIHKKEKSEEHPVDARIDTMPGIFYGGQDPLVYRAPAPPPKAEFPHPQPSSSAPAILPQAGMSKSSITPSPQQPPASPLMSTAPSSPSLFSKKWMWISATIVFVLAVGSIIWYYLRQARPSKQAVPPGQISLTTRTIPASAPVPAVVPALTPTTSPAESAPTTTPSAVPGSAIDFPRLALVDSSDLDGDELTDVEEELFGTDTGIWDSDGDSYYDGQEVFNLYNPKGTAPIKLIDSGLIREYRNPSIGYRLYYPKAWQVDGVSEDNTQVIITGVTGDFIEIRALPRTADETFERWFAVNAPRQKITDLENFVNRFGISIKVRTDKLVAYIEDGARMLVVTYHPFDNGAVTLRHIIQMVIQGIRPSTASVPPPLTASTSASTSTP